MPVEFKIKRLCQERGRRQANHLRIQRLNRKSYFFLKKDKAEVSEMQHMKATRALFSADLLIYVSKPLGVVVVVVF